MARSSVSGDGARGKWARVVLGGMHNGAASESKGHCRGSHICGGHDRGFDDRASALPRNNGTRHGLLSPATANAVDRAVASLAGTSSVAVRALRLGGPPSTTSTRTRSPATRRYRFQSHDQFVHVKPSAAKRLLASSALLPPKSLAASTRDLRGQKTAISYKAAGGFLYFSPFQEAHTAQNATCLRQREDMTGTDARGLFGRRGRGAQDPAQAGL